MKNSLVTLLSLLVFSATACKGPPTVAPTQSSGTPEVRASAAGPAEEAQTLYRDRCAVCHGAQGAGDGVAGAALNPRPRNFQESAWQTATTDDQIERVIREGGAAIGKSPAMPPNPDLVSRPAVVAALRQHIRAMRR